MDGLHELVEKILWAVSYYRLRRDAGDNVFLSLCPEHPRLENNTFAA